MTKKEWIMIGILMSGLFYLSTLIYWTDIESACKICGVKKQNDNLKWHHIAGYCWLWFIIIYALQDKRKGIELFILCLNKAIIGALFFTQFGMPHDWRWIEFSGMDIAVIEAIYEYRKKNIK